MALARYLALDIGGTKLAAGLVDESGHVTCSKTAPTLRERGAADTVARLLALGQAAHRECGEPALTGIGIACGGPLDPVEGVVLSPPGLPDWDHVEICRAATGAFGAPAVLENDASAGALAEYLWGPRRGSSSLLYMTISTGIGGGWIHDGVPYLGHSGNGVEVGHLRLDWRGRPCACGARGCAEAYVSGRAIAAIAAERVAAGAATSLAALETVRAEDVVAAARAGDRLAGELWADTMAATGALLASVINAFDPEHLVIGGGVVRSEPAYVETVRRLALASVMSPSRSRTTIDAARAGVDIGVLGAAAAYAYRAGVRPDSSEEVAA